MLNHYSNKVFTLKSLFTIGRQFICSSGLSLETRTLYVPPEQSIEPGFRYLLNKGVKRLNTDQRRFYNKPLNPISPEDIDKIAQYVMQDQKDRKVIDKNISQDKWLMQY